ncbi:MAG: SAM-dependent methyltransferase [Rhizobium sp.]|nr:MAG: SAM-dependent methyltransferase [Rhizobium sp.]
MIDTIEYGKNDSLRDEIKAYWSGRAATFDLSPGHEIFSEEEREAWHALILKHLGPGEGRSSRGRSIRFFVGDAENTMEPDESADVIITRHLVWTLVDPRASFAEWFRVLKPGGRLLIVDGDFVNTSWREKLVKKLAAGLEGLGLVKQDQPHKPADPENTFTSILSRVYFSNGARAGEVAALLRQTGFQPVAIDQELQAIHRAQAKNFSLLKGILRGLQHRYAVCAVKPDITGKT